MASKAIHFNKKIDEYNVQSGVLRMPRSFVSKYWDKCISNPISLVVPNARWNVTWEQHGCDVIMLGNQWKKFVMHYSLDVEYYLRFSYRHDLHVRRSQFYVEIHDESGLELDHYPLKEGSTNSDEESDKSTYDSNNENVNGSSRRQKKRAKSPLLVSGPPKKVKTNTKEGKKSCQKHPGTESQKVEVKLENNTKEKNTGKGKINHAKGGCSKSDAVESEEKLLKDTKIGSAYELALNFSSENDFICIMGSSYIERNAISMPRKFIPAHLQKEAGEVTLWDFEKKFKWDAKFRLNPTSNQVSLTTAWKNFRDDNNLKIGDVCVFQKMISAGVSYRVKIFRAEEATSPHIVEAHEDRAEAKTRKQKKLQNNFDERSNEGIAKKCARTHDMDHDSAGPGNNSTRLENQFTITIKNTQMDEKRIPMQFIKKYVTDSDRRVTHVTVQAKEKKCSLQLYYDPENQSARFFSAGWSKFVRDFELVEGDECLFELVDEEKIVLQVTVTRRIL